MMIEFLKGSLPWSNIENKEDVGRRKIELDSLDLVAGLPQEMASFMEHLRTLDYRDKPNYDFIADLCNQMMENAGVTEEEPYDWELKEGPAQNAEGFRVSSRGREQGGEVGGEPRDGKRGSRRSKAEPGSSQPKAKRSSRKSRSSDREQVPEIPMLPDVGEVNMRQPSPRDVASPASDDGGALDGEDPDGGNSLGPIASGNAGSLDEPPERAQPGNGCQCVMM